MSEEENMRLSILCVIIVTIEEISYNAYTVTQKCTSHLLFFSFHTFKAFSDKCVKTKEALLTFATVSTHHQPQQATSF